MCFWEEGLSLWMQVPTEARQGQISLELELWMAVSKPIWVLGTEIGSSAR